MSPLLPSGTAAGSDASDMAPAAATFPAEGTSSPAAGQGSGGVPQGGGGGAGPEPLREPQSPLFRLLSSSKLNRRGEEDAQKGGEK